MLTLDMAMTKAQIQSVFEGMHRGESVSKQLKAMGIQPIDFHRAVNEGADLQQEYAQAREARGDALADEVVDIADNEDNPYKARNRIDTRKWVAAKMKPNVYGDRLELNVTQTVDISAALQEARKRTRDIAPSQPELSEPKKQIAQCVDITEQAQLGKEDKVSPIVPNESLGAKTEIDIFS